MSYSPHEPSPSQVSELEDSFSQISELEDSVFLDNDVPLQGCDHFRSVFVSGLAAFSFDNFISNKEKALIYFYNTNKPTDLSLEPTFVKAAENIANLAYGFGTIDCLYDQRLCEQLKVTRTPTLKLFSNGFDVSTIEVPQDLNANQIHMLMKMTPILTRPRQELGQEFLEQPEVCKTPQKKHKLLCF
ncbi:hypothetical protein BsWGS_20179 [Bradybaena similaris]